MKAVVIGITGSPGCGKSYFSKMLLRSLGTAESIELSELAIRSGFVIGRDKDGTSLVDIGRLAAAVRKRIRRATTPILIVGHLLPELGIKVDIMVVVRAPLSLMRSRLAARHYTLSKMSDNIICEALDYCGEMSVGKSRELYEVETAAGKKAVISYITARCSGKKAQYPKSESTDKLGELACMIAKRQVLQFTPSKS
jgi:broad-specificity NMP kinase